MPHPWRTLRALPRITLVWADLPTGVRGLTDGHSRIWLHRRLLQRERRAALAHELVHIERGHRGCQPPSIERAVRQAVARWLLPDLRAVCDELVFYAGHLELVAEALWVDRVTVEARLECLTAGEREYLSTRLAWV